MDYRLTIVSTVDVLREELAVARGEGKKIALIPTMGALHEGHLSLVDQAKERADFTAVSIFVNPAQFGEGEDLENYPRSLSDDIRLLENRKVDLVFTPQVSEMYGDTFSTNISVSGISDCLCGASRPHHFDGVATIVTKLLLQARPDFAVFGEKDFQQLQVIKRVVQDLNIETEIVGTPIVRGGDGLALSSRNEYLSDEQKEIAATLYKALQETAKQLLQGSDIEPTVKETIEKLRDAGFEPEYVEVRDEQNLALTSGKLESEENIDNPQRLFVAARLGDTRLIDNIAL